MADTSPSVFSWSEHAARAFAAALEELASGADVRRLGDPVVVGRRAALVAAAGQVWTDQLGPFYDSDAVRKLLGGVSRQAVSDRARRGVLLVLRTGAGRLVYPAFQFDRNGTVRGLPDVLAVFDLDDISAWTVASWLATPDPDLDGRRPVDALRDGDLGTVLSAARDVAAGLAA